MFLAPSSEPIMNLPMRYYKLYFLSLYFEAHEQCWYNNKKVFSMQQYLPICISYRFPLESFDDDHPVSRSIIVVILFEMATNPSSNGALGRLKKSPPPPLVLPKRITAMDDQNIPNSTEQYEQKKSQDSYCSSSSSKDCTHRSIPYVSRGHSSLFL